MFFDKNSKSEKLGQITPEFWEKFYDFFWLQVFVRVLLLGIFLGSFESHLSSFLFEALNYLKQLEIN